MGTFVPLGGGGQAAPQGGFVPLKAYAVEGDPDYQREKAKALVERGQGDTRNVGVRQRMADVKAGKAGLGSWTLTENLANAARVLGGNSLTGELLARGLESDNAFTRGVNKVGRIGDVLTGQAPLPVLDELNAGVRAGGNAAANLYRRATGKREVSSEAIYRGQLDADREIKARERAEYPVSSVAGSLLSGLPAAPEAVGAKLLATGATKAPLLARAGQYAGNVAKGAGVGAAYGAAYGAADAAPGHRGEGAQEGALLGGLTGGTLEAAAPVIIPAAGKAKDAVVGLIRSARKPSAEAEAERGTQTALKILQRKGLTADVAAERAAEYAPGIEPSAAELAGDDVVRLAGATARRGGTTGEAALALKEQRKAGAGDRVLEAAKENLGVDPAAARGDLEAAVTAGRQRANPEYAAMRDVKAGITSPELEGILQRPHVQRVLKEIEANSDTAGVEPYGLAWGDVDVPHAPVGPDDLSFAATGAPSEMPVPRGPARLPSSGESALTYLRNTGHGIEEAAAGEAKQLGLRLAAKKGGNELNDMAIALHEGGYTGYVPSETQMEELLNTGAIRRMYAKEPDAAALQRHQARMSAEEFNARGGNPEDLPHPEDYGNAGPAPERPTTEPARTRALTQESWDRVLSALDQMVQRDELTGKVMTSGPSGFRNRALQTAATDMRRALFGGEGVGPNLAPELRAARDVSGDYQAIRSAYDRAKGKLTRGTYRDLENVWNSAKNDAEQEAMRSAIANDIYELVQAGQVRAGRITTPRVMAKLELMFPGQAKGFVSRIEQEAKLAGTANRMAPTGGSPTFGLGEAGKEADQAMQLGDWARIVGKAARGKWGQAGLDAVVTPVRKAYRAYETAGLSEDARNAMGRVLLMGPDELVPLLRDFERLPDPVRRVVYDRAVALGLIPGGAAARAGAGDAQDAR